jgi:hypothetical protein
MDTNLVALAARAPAWVQLVISWFALAWALATLAAGVARTIPEARYTALETAVPRLAWLLRASRKFGTDVWPAITAFASAAAGVAVPLVVRMPFATPLDPPPASDLVRPSMERTTRVPPLPILLCLALLVGCSASAVHRQAVVADTFARIANAGLAVVERVYHDEQIAAARLVCGGAEPCDTTHNADARDAVLAVRAKWAPVKAVWDLAMVAHAAWSTQLDACQRDAADAGDDGGCSVQLDVLAAGVLAHTTDLRCALRGIGVTDPFPGAVDCGGPALRDGGAE